MRVIAIVCLAAIGALSAGVAASDPPYDVTVTFGAPTTGGPVDGYRLYQGCRAGETKTLVGTATSGQKYTALLTADGTYSFCVHAYNATGEGPSSNVVVATINDFDPVPGAPTNLTVTVSCDASCTVNITSEPAP